jgi:hypothetical protein
MTRLRPRAEKAESLFVENLKPFSTASVIRVGSGLSAFGGIMDEFSNQGREWPVAEVAIPVSSPTTQYKRPEPKYNIERARPGSGFSGSNTWEACREHHPTPCAVGSHRAPV